ncbi:hypothetical protein BB560_006297, partial [Smittium megazygosporum]
MADENENENIISFLDYTFTTLESLVNVESLLQAKEDSLQIKLKKKNLALQQLEGFKTQFQKDKDVSLKEISSVRANLLEIERHKDSPTSIISSSGDATLLVRSLREDFEKLHILKTAKDILLVIDKVNDLGQKAEEELRLDIYPSAQSLFHILTIYFKFVQIENQSNPSISSPGDDSNEESGVNPNSEKALFATRFIQSKIIYLWKKMINFLV